MARKFRRQAELICPRAWRRRCNEWTPLPADPLEGVRSVGAVRGVLIYGRQRLRGTVAREDRKTEFRTPNPKPRTPNLQASIEHRCRDRMAIAGRSPLRRRPRNNAVSGSQQLRGIAAVRLWEANSDLSVAVVLTGREARVLPHQMSGRRLGTPDRPNKTVRVL